MTPFEFLEKNYRSS